ncbi:MAG: YifB family Mg chelatase-like AAA ATPase [Syntrophales bacterium]|nr:YifB family Mg chelatase-like AAA ATPase [Syntrophales bacterium]
MIVKVISCATIGINAYRVDVEVDTSTGLPHFSTVGLPDVAVKESKDRIKAAVKNSGYPFPRHHVTVNLAPADVRKEGTSFDLPIAVAILATQSLIDVARLSDYLILGELSLDGGVKGVRGVMSAAFLGRSLGLRGIILPFDNAYETSFVQGIDVFPVRHLSDVVEFLGGRKEIEPFKGNIDEILKRRSTYSVDFRDVAGQDHVKRALEVAAAGGHNVLMIGPPGSGKTMLAMRLPTILPELSFEEAIETTKIYSVAGLLSRDECIITNRPFRNPHHTISDAGLVGGGQTPKPGEISLAHNGVLFLDELPEFRRNVLESLRQPMEEGTVTISRSTISITFPARFMLVAAMNPCVCGHYGDAVRVCRCTAQQIRQYQGRISGPLLDRIDIHVTVPAVRHRDIRGRYSAESSAAIRERVVRARDVQRRRFTSREGVLNARMTEADIKEFCRLDEESMRILEMAMEKLGLSARAYAKVLKVARTIADLDGSFEIKTPHVAEAIQYRSLDMRIV